MAEQPRVYELIPLSLWTLALVFMAGLVVAAGLVALHVWGVGVLADGTRLAAFDLGAEGSLATWFSSLTLLGAVVMAILVYSIRRYRADDYRGRYRVWLWAAALWLLMATDEAASLHEAFALGMTWAAGTPLWGDGSLWWMLCYGFLLGAVGSRLLLDMRECALSTGALLMAGAAYGLDAAVRLGVVPVGGRVEPLLVEQGSELAGNLLLLLAMALHARHVRLDAQGLLPRSAEETNCQTGGEAELGTGTGMDSSPLESENTLQRPVVAAKGATVAGGGRWRKVESPHPTPPAPAHSSLGGKVVGSSAASSAGNIAGALVGGGQSETRQALSKAEKKALRKRLMEERLRREREQQERWK